MGRPLMWVPGASGSALVGSGYAGSEIIAALSILSYAATMAAKRGVRVIASTAWPEVTLLIEDVLRTTYATEGKPEMYNPNDIRFAPGWFPYVTATMGWIGRERPATCLIVGPFGHESLTISESAWRSGAFGIGGCYGVHQLPWIIACNEYSFIGMELFVAGAYIARDPDQLGSIVATDILVFAVIAVVIIGVIVATGGSWAVRDFWKL